MDGLALLGILLLLYAGMVFFITFKKPEKIWNISKIKAFKRVLGEKGTVIFFYAFGLVALGLGVWLISK